MAFARRKLERAWAPIDDMTFATARPTRFTTIVFTASLACLALSLCLAIAYFITRVHQVGYVGLGALFVGLLTLYWSLDRAEYDLEVAA
jgi:hypothetical protein